MALKNLFVTTILTSYFTIIYYHHITFIYYHHNECNIIDTLCDQLNKFSPNDMIFMGGDFNSRIGTQNDFIIGNEKDLNYLPQDYQLDTIRLVRNNQDTSVNENGQQLLDLRALDICRLPWLQYSRFSFSIRSISEKDNYSTVCFSSRFQFFV